MAPASRALDTGTDLLSAQQKEKKKIQNHMLYVIPWGWDLGYLGSTLKYK